jgi:hypothetical protein
MVDHSLDPGSKLRKKLRSFVGGEKDKQLLHRVGTSRSDGLHKTLTFKGENLARNFMCDAVGLESIELKGDR